MLRYLIDEHLRGTLTQAMVRLARQQGFELDVVEVGARPDLPLGMDDPELIRWAEVEDRVLVSLDTRTLPDHLARHLAAGRHSPGIFIARRPLNIALARWLVLFAYASEPDEWRDRVTFVPLSLSL